MQPTPSTGEQRSWAKATGFLVALYLVGLALIAGIVLVAGGKDGGGGSAGGSGVCACSFTPQCVSFDAPMSYVLRSLNSCALPSFQFCTGR